MCGIIGQINFDKNDIIVEPEFLRMRDTLFHRGPDQAGIHIEKNIGLAFRRLSIIDLSANAAQPMSNEDGSIWLVFNGEFYNFLDYRDQLIKQGHIFKSNSDTEVIIHLYEQYGINCLEKINGMFALCLYDKSKKLLFLTRDRFGVKPLYYYLDQQKLVFASEIKAIMADRRNKREINLNSLTEYLSFGYILPPNSIFKNIRKVRPSHYLIFDLMKNEFVGEEPYWRLEIKVNNKINFNDWREKLLTALNKAIKIRLASDVPLGVLLSGGVDSSTIVALLSRLSDKKIKTFSIGFKEKEYNETSYSRLIANKFATEHYEMIIQPDAIEALPKLAWYYDEPFDDPSALPTYYLAQMARQNVTVALSGDGGDELLAGYPRYRDFYRINSFFQPFPEILKKAIFSTAFSLYPAKLRGKRLLYLLSLPTAEAYREFMKSFNRPEIRQLLSKEVLAETVQENEEVNFSAWFNGGEYLRKNKVKFVTGLQYIDYLTYLPGDILTKVDIASMSHSLEVRSPFLDYELWQLVFSMPEETRFNNYQGKYILKETMAGVLGKDFVYRGKMGFGVPLNYWFNGQLEEYAREILLGKKFIGRGFFNLDYLNKIFSIHKSGRRDFSRKIWGLLFFEHWCRNWLD